MDEMTTDVEVSTADPKVQAVLVVVKGLGTLFAITGGIVAGIAASKEFNKTIAAVVAKKLESN